MTVSYRVGVDIGGTFTDIVLLGSDGTIHTKKISSSVGNYAQAIVDGLTEVFGETRLDGGAIEEIRHGTTVAAEAPRIGLGGLENSIERIVRLAEQPIAPGRPPRRQSPDLVTVSFQPATPHPFHGRCASPFDRPTPASRRISTVWCSM